MGASSVAVLHVDSDSEEEEARLERGGGFVEDDVAEEEKEDSDGAGLAAEELKPERLYAGDTIEYFSMAFVFGDPRGHNVAKVLKVQRDDEQYPLRLDSQEMLPSAQMIKRKRNRRGEEMEAGDAVWRKIRTFELIDGQVKGATRADRLNEGMKNAVSEAFKATRDIMDKQKAEKNTLAISSFFKPKNSVEKMKTKTPASPQKTFFHEKGSSALEKTPVNSLKKRPRIDVTPSPGSSSASHALKLKRQDRERDSDLDFDFESPASSKTPTKKKRRHSDQRKNRINLTKYVDSIEEKKGKTVLTKHIISLEKKKKSHAIDLDSYLEYDRQQREAIEELKTGKLTAEHSQTKSNRERRDEPARKRPDPGRHRGPTLDRFFRKPQKPPEKTEAKSSKLNFFMSGDDSANESRGAIGKASPRHRLGSSRDRDPKPHRDEKKPRQSVKKKLPTTTQPRMDTWISKR